ncbi:hypothetical protein SteCoe_33208 [Stentor coeruleus]|uniref:Uncharacterized protein n=1 Tax=Stentor coeruleus TaxID=5963 RepID=A0A1R2AXH3_9CILI|nr:hypothetical protein SteCoe_33208 [Stentor coeruleus]
MNSKKSINYENVMTRMEWFHNFKAIFNTLTTEEDILAPVDKLLLLKELNIRIPKLPFKNPELYYTKSKVQGFSLGEILSHINSLEDHFLTFDQFIDSLIYLSIDKKRKQKKASIRFKANPIPELSPHRQTYTFSYESTCSDTIPKAFSKSSQNISGNYFLPSDQDNNFSSISIQKVSTDNEKPSVRTPSPINNCALDLSFPDIKLITYPEIKTQGNLQYLSLAGNSLISTKYDFPQGLIVLNLASNHFSELKFQVNLPNLSLLNLTSNQISLIKETSSFLNIKELYIANNCITTINILCYLTSLYLIDCSYNEIQSFEDIAQLAISKKLGILKLRGNPISSLDNYKESVISILSRLYCFDPLNIISLSYYKNLGSLPFLPIKDIFEEVNEKMITKNPSEGSIVNKNKPSLIRNYSQNDMQNHSKITKVNSVIISNQSFKEKSHSKSNSIIRNNKKLNFTNTTKGSFNMSESDDIDMKNYGKSFTSMKDSMARVKNKKLLCTAGNPNINNGCKREFGKPEIAVMVGPPAVRNIKSKVCGKSPKCISLDISKKRKFK